MGRIKETTIDDKYIGNIDQRMYGEEVIVMSSEIIQRKMLPKYIEVRGAKVHNLKNIDVNIPLHEIVAIEVFGISLDLYAPEDDAGGTGGCG